MTTRIWDVFTYCGERPVLEVRRMELAILGVRELPVELTVTFTGAPRRVELPNAYVSIPAGDAPVEREDSARRACRRALEARGAEPDDWVIFGDADEVPAADAVLMAVNVARSPVVLRMPYHSLLATWRLPLDRDTWNFRWPVVGRLRDLDALWPDWAALRAESGLIQPLESLHPRFAECGWHLSSMGGPDAVLPKVAAFAHAGEPWTVGLDADRLRQLARKGRDVADRFTQTRVAIAGLPWAIREHPAHYRHLLDWTAW